ncbi:MAG: AEC family transporter, partial [Chthoniobacterales bacterium]
MTAQFFSVLQILAPIFLVMAAGFGMRRIGMLSAEADRSLGALVVTLLAPSLAFDVILGNEALTKPGNWLL